MNKPKVCILTLHSTTCTGATIQAFRLARQLKKLGANPFMVFYPTGENTKLIPCHNTFYLEQAQSEGIAVYKKPDDMLDKRSIYKFYLKLFWHKRSEYQVVYINGTSKVGSFLIPFLKLLGKKIVFKMTGLGFNDPDSLRKNQHYSWLEFKLLMLVDRFVGTSEAICKAYLTSNLFAEKKLTKIPNGVDTDLFAPLETQQEKLALKKKLGLPLEHKIVAYVGNIRREKGVDLLVNSWVQVIKNYPAATLVMIGPFCPICGGTFADKNFVDLLKEKAGILLFDTGPEIKLLRMSKPKNNIYLLDTKNNIHEYLRASDIFAFPSRKEGMPNALMEAMSSGLPCVSLDIEEITGELIGSKEEGVAVAGENADAFSGAIVELLQDDAKRVKIGLAARKKMVSEFSLEKTAKQHYALYQELCA